MSGSSSWNHSGFAFAPNTNTLDAQSMPSDKAQAAREKAKEIMLALEDGKPGEADKMMGKREAKGTHGIIPLDWLKTKFSSSKKDKTKGDDLQHSTQSIETRQELDSTDIHPAQIQRDLQPIQIANSNTQRSTQVTDMSSSYSGTGHGNAHRTISTLGHGSIHRSVSTSGHTSTPDSTSPSMFGRTHRSSSTSGHANTHRSTATSGHGGTHRSNNAAGHGSTHRSSSASGHGHTSGHSHSSGHSSRDIASEFDRLSMVSSSRHDSHRTTHESPARSSSSAAAPSGLSRAPTSHRSHRPSPLGPDWTPPASTRAGGLSTIREEPTLRSSASSTLRASNSNALVPYNRGSSSVSRSGPISSYDPPRSTSSRTDLPLARLPSQSASRSEQRSSSRTVAPGGSSGNHGCSHCHGRGHVPEINLHIHSCCCSHHGVEIVEVPGGLVIFP